ncbi:MAG TPA: VOC family protein [Chitinophagaceae bacterium]|nr:VOC family protein [Chitinophagaceae bacterium]
MSKQYKPQGYNSVSPYFVVKEGQRYIDLIRKMFDAKELRRYDNEDGSIMHAELQVDDSVIMIGEASDKYPPNHHLIHVYVADVDAVFEKAIAAGCIAEETPKKREGDPDKRGSFKDFAGNTWAIGTQLEDF